VRVRALRFTTPMSDETPAAPEELDHTTLTDDQLAGRLEAHRRDSAEWAAALLEVQRRGDRLHSDERFRAALGRAQDPPAPRGGGGDS
jgi:hypothetical protein